MADTSRIDALYDSTLKPRLDAMEGLRLSLKGYLGKAFTLIGTPFVIFYFRGVLGFVLPDWAVTLVGVVSFIGITVGVVVAMRYAMPGLTAYANYTARFKNEIVSEIFKAVCPTATYAAHQGIPGAVFDSPGIFSTQGAFMSEDRVRGHIGRTPFEAGDVQRRYSSGGQDSHTYVVFHGLFFHFDFNKALRGVTIVQPEGAPAHQLGERQGLSAVSLEDPEFARAFTVYASSEVEARYVLTPAMMERLLAVRAEARKPVFLGFKNSGAYIGIDYGRSLFEPGIGATTSKAAIQEMAAHFALAEFIVSELDLNTRIWTKDVDESFLRQPDREPKGLMDLPAAQAGTLTEKDLWATATAAVGGGYDKDEGVDVPRPDRTRIRVDSHAGRTTIRYGLPTSFFVLLSISMAGAAICLSAVKSLASTPLAGPFGSLFARLSTLPALDALVGEYGIAWFIGGALVGGLISIGWALRVRRVDVTPDAVRIYRGLRPFPRVYPRPTYGRVVRVKEAVYVGKVDSPGPMNPTASPMLSDAEAAWIASELRRALT